MAFQPIVDVRDRSTFAHEALVRGPNGEPASAVFAAVNDSNQYRFDQTCRIKAIEMAARLNMPTMLSINFMPNAVYQAETCIQATLNAGREFGFPVDQLMFEITEADKVKDREHLRNIIEFYKRTGMTTAIDDFGAGYSGLNLLADFVPDVVKLDMALIRNIDHSRTRLAIVKHMLALCHELEVKVIAEGVESRQERDALMDLGIFLFQGFLFARPAFEAMPEVDPAGFA
ncbi:MAG: EAL domain-containing protein [Wenzhouxiangella sp.]